METTSIEIGDVVVRAPVTAGTNLLLAVQCAVYFARSRTTDSRRARWWGGFFAMMALATLAGVFKHGARQALSADGLTLMLAVSSLASGVATLLAQEATLISYARAGERLRLLIDVQLAFFIAVNVIFGPEMTFLIVNTAVGLLPVIVVEATRRRTVKGGGLVAGGLALSLLTGLVYVGELAVGRWLNHIDIAHFIMGLSFYLIHRGLGASERAAWR